LVTGMVTALPELDPVYEGLWSPLRGAARFSESQRNLTVHLLVP
jgi:hypothetical protein